jgi:hypothetical protein
VISYNRGNIVVSCVDFGSAMAVAVMEVDEAQTPTIQYGNMYVQLNLEHNRYG